MPPGQGGHGEVVAPLLVLADGESPRIGVTAIEPLEVLDGDVGQLNSTSNDPVGRRDPWGVRSDSARASQMPRPVGDETSETTGCRRDYGRCTFMGTRRAPRFGAALLAPLDADHDVVGLDGVPAGVVEGDALAVANDGERELTRRRLHRASDLGRGDGPLGDV